MEGGKLAVVGLSCFREGMTGTHSLGRSVDAESKKRIVSDIQPPSSSALLDLMFLASKLGFRMQFSSRHLRRWSFDG